MQTGRMTKQRALILAELRGSFSHPTADEIYAMVRVKMPHISLGTVYRNLDLLAENNEILKLEYAGFQRRFDGNTHPHHHARCERCGKVVDVAGDVPVPDLPEHLEAQGFKINSARLEFFGVCKDCG